MPTTANSITYFVAADGTLRDGQQGSIAQQPRINYGTEYAVTLSFPPSTIAEGDQLQVALNRTRTFFSSASATGDAPVAAVVKHDVTAEEAAAQEVAVVLSTNTRAMIDQVNGIDHPVRGFFGVHVLRGQSFVTLAVADALMMSLESGPDAISPSLPVVDYPTRQEAEALAERSENAAERAEEAAAGIVPPLQLSSPPTTSTVGSVGQLAVWHDAEATDQSKADHEYHLLYIVESAGGKEYIWREDVTANQGNVAGGYPILNANGRIAAEQLRDFSILKGGTSGASLIIGFNQNNINRAGIALGSGNNQTSYAAYYNLMVGQGLRANKDFQTVFGKYNIIGDQLFIIGNGNSNMRSNAMSVDANGNVMIQGDYQQQITEIPPATSDYTLYDGLFAHAPTTAPTYRLPQVTNTTISHYIELTVDFTAVQTYSFLDYQGEPIVPLFTPSIAVGDVYTFKMEYSAIKAAWLIYPQKQGAVADDFVMRGEVGAANGVAGLNGNALIPASELPIATEQLTGGVKLGNSGIGYGSIRALSSGNLYVHPQTHGHIDVRYQNPSGAIMASNLNYAVTAALTDANHITLTDAQKATAQSVFGVGGPITAIPAATSAYTLTEGIFTHAPTSAPTYTLPNITDDIRTHKVVLIIDFSSVQTFSFLVDGGGDVTFQSYANPTTGDVWAFRCWWYGGKWRIAPTKIKNCVTRQFTNGSLAITDAIAGDALALKMTAPRSVVMNQLSQSTVGSYWQNTGNVSKTFANDVFTLTSSTDSVVSKSARYGIGSAFVHGHVYAIYAELKTDGTSQPRFGIRTNDYTINIWYLTTNAISTEISDWQKCSAVGAVTDSSTNKALVIALDNTDGTGTSAQFRNMMLVDLTQYFNGDQTIIESITSWDDLVAYDPRFASYVEYNTGTVTGVQPTVKVSGKNLFDAEHAELVATAGTITISSRSAGTIVATDSASASNYLIFDFMPIKAEYPVSAFRCSCKINGSVPASMSNAIYLAERNNRLCVFLRSGASGDITFSNIQIELGSVATAYEPYHDGGTVQATAPLFAVGNAADEYEAVSGVTTEAVGKVNLGTLDWSRSASGLYLAVIADSVIGTTSSSAPCLCTKLNTVALITAQSPDWSCKIGINSTLYVAYSGTSDVDIFKGLVNGSYLYYQRTTPTTSSSTPTQISLQAGNNVAMQTDGGRLAPIDITYESDEL